MEEEKQQNPAQSETDTPAELRAAAETAEAHTETEESAEDVYTFKQFLLDALDLLESVATAVFVVMLVFTYLFCTANVDGESMLPTLEDGDRLVVSRLDKHFETGDILIIDSIHSNLFDANGALYESPGLGKNIVKRLIAQGGQEVYINFEEGIVYVDGEALDEPYVSTLTTRDNRAFTYPFTVPDGYAFVLGDNRYISKDSRHPEVGLVSMDEIVGPVLLRISPFSKFGKVE